MNALVLFPYCSCSYGIAAVSPFSHRLTFNGLPPEIQRLRCKVNFEALTFVPHIRELGDTLINRLRYPETHIQSSGTAQLKEREKMVKNGITGKFVVLHLRFDKVK